MANSIIRVLATYLLLATTLNAQNMWLWNQRTHPELEWKTLHTEHFNIHFHQGIENIARRGAAIAEQAYQPIMDQLELADFGQTDIVFSAEDEIMNGFAMPSDQIFIWVSQNDVAGHFSGSDKWLKMVITHEFQHVAQFQAHRTWAGLLAGASIPLWWYEGMAEYMTEVWRVGRSDARMKIHTYKNTLNRMDPHDDGYAKVLYLAHRYGDSTLVKISRHRLYLDPREERYPIWYDFGTAFKSATGQSLGSFNEEWRRVMNTYYYGYKAQKESVDEVGQTFSFPGMTRVRSARLSPHRTAIAIIGRAERGMRDYGLYVQRLDSTNALDEVHFGRFSGAPAWSPTEDRLVVSEYHRGSYGSLIYDLRMVDLSTGKVSWLTSDLRTHHPVFSQDGNGLYFVAHPEETSQIYFIDLQSGEIDQISEFTGDVQIRDLSLDSRGGALLFSMQDSDGNVDIALMKTDGSGLRKITNDPEEDLYPLWAQGDSTIVFTSYRSGTPNLYRMSHDSSAITQMTDVAEGIFSAQLDQGTGQILAQTLADVDTTRWVKVDVDREVEAGTLNIRPRYSDWRTTRPQIPIPHIVTDSLATLYPAVPYRARRSVRPLMQLLIPDEIGLYAMGLYNDALGKHMLQAATVLGWDGTLAGGYLSYTNFNFRPVVRVFGSKNFALSLRRSFEESYVEMRNGVGLAMDLPMNRGNRLSSNHHLNLKLQLLERQLVVDPDWIALSAGEEMTTTDTRETNMGLTYSWKSQRPHTQQYVLPQDGLGVLAHAETTLPDVYGENDYAQVWLEAFGNYALPKTPAVLYSRLKWVKQGGTILNQDQLGFSESAPIAISNPIWNTIEMTGLIDLPESYSLRGQTGHYIGGELIYSVTELRLPLMDKLPVNILGLGLRNLTTAAFLDIGVLPETSTDLSTYGFEFKVDLSLMEQSLVTLALGWGGDEDFWTSEAFEREPYLRMVMVNPF